MKKLFRSSSDRVIAGVCGGLAKYFKIDVNLIRFFWLIASLFGGAGILAYIVAWIIIPDDKTKTSLMDEWTAEAEGKKVKKSHSKSDHPEMLVGAFLIFLGVMFLSNNIGLFAWTWGYTWPSIFIFIGVIIIFSRRNR